jgi:Uma2 family endonuclease
MNAMPLVYEEIEYPTSDGQPLAETTTHFEVITDLVAALKRRYHDVPNVWVGANLFLCYEQGKPRAAVAPDVLLARGVSRWNRPNYLLWEERPPALVVEVTSKSTRYRDQRKKKKIYQRIGVEEYVLFDPLDEYLKPRLQGYRLKDGRYARIPLKPDGSLLSRTTGLVLKPEGWNLRLIDTATGERLLWKDEAEQAHKAAEKQALQEAEARRVAEQRALREAEARQVAEQRALQEAEARQVAEDRLRALEEEIARLRSSRAAD